jgi:hypothetical protein
MTSSSYSASSSSAVLIVSTTLSLSSSDYKISVVVLPSCPCLFPCICMISVLSFFCNPFLILCCFFLYLTEIKLVFDISFAGGIFAVGGMVLLGQYTPVSTWKTNFSASISSSFVQSYGLNPLGTLLPPVGGDIGIVFNVLLLVLSFSSW